MSYNSNIEWTDGTWKTDRTIFRSRIAGLNIALGGGFRRGEATLIGGATGGGKTILACQLAFEFGASGARVTLITTEGSAQDLIPRFIANATSTNVGILRPSSEEEYSAVLESLSSDPRTMVGMAQVTYVLGSDVRIIERNYEGYRPMRDLLGDVGKAMEDDHFTPDVLIFDWIDYNEGRGVTDPFEKRRRYKESADSFASSCRQHRVAGIIFCQLALGLVRNKTTEVDSHFVAEAKNMTEHMANFIGISSLPRRGLVTGLGVYERRQYFFVQPQNRRSQKVPVEQQFEYQRFAGVDGQSL